MKDRSRRKKQGRTAMGTHQSTSTIKIVESAKPLQLDSEIETVFVDLDKFEGVTVEERAERVLKWVAGQRTRFKAPDTLFPGIVALGTSSLKSDAATQLLWNAGVFFRKKPEGYDDIPSKEDRATFLEEWLQRLHKEIEPFDDQLNSQRVIRRRRAKVPSAGSPPPWQPYLDPPYPLSPEDYDRLMRRLQTPDNDRDKDA